MTKWKVLVPKFAEGDLETEIIEAEACRVIDGALVLANFDQELQAMQLVKGFSADSWIAVEKVRETH
ncbi:MAG: hypothetical protein KGL39_24555 [Patescibacteria group bacterium]|nr:hypothetical protein [Patescibacteria group bacterium]